MSQLNKKSLLFGLILGFLSWLWAFIIVGSAFFDYTTNQPIENPDPGLYIILLIINFMLTIVILAIYLWKYEQNNPIIERIWYKDAILLGIILCTMNFLLDAVFFGIQGRNLLTYFFIETTTGYMYPLIILETILLAYLIYGRKEG
jgi:hypothetical protein